MGGMPNSTLFGRRFLGDVRRLTSIYWMSPGGRGGAALLALAVALELGAVYGNFEIAGAQKRVFDSVEAKQLPAFLTAMGGFLAIVLGFVLVSAWRVYARQWLEMRWRQSMTSHYLHHWIGPQAYVQRELHANEADNPDQRIAEDIRNFVASTLGLGLSLLSALATLVSFSGLLWSLSADWPLHVGGRPVRIPGLMMWVAVAYAIVAMALTHLVGRALVPINFDRQRVEADFRYGLVRFRDNVEPVALARGEAFEQRSAVGRFERVMENWWRLIGAQRRLNVFTAMIGQTNAVVPLLIAAPAYFSGWISLGSVAQTRVAYGQVSGALAWFVYAYQEIAQWRASVERLSRFADVLDAAKADLARTDGVRIVETTEPSLRFRDLRLALPDGRTLLEPTTATVSPGQRIAIVAPAGTGKTTLFRAIAGIWPHGSGTIEVPSRARTIFVPERPYLPIGTVREVVAYPSAPATFASEQIIRVLARLGLERLSTELDTVGAWQEQLSADEQQRISIARVLLHEPDWVFFDDALAALEPDMESRIFAILDESLPASAILALTRKPTVGLTCDRWVLQTSRGGTTTLSASSAVR